MQRILIVEDDLDIQELLKNFFRKLDTPLLLQVMVLKQYPFLQAHILT